MEYNSHIENTKNRISMYYSDKKKRHRRTAEEIERMFKCPYAPCTKSYGSEGSLSQHIKLKHPQYYYGTDQYKTPGK